MAVKLQSIFVPTLIFSFTFSCLPQSDPKALVQPIHNDSSQSLGEPNNQTATEIFEAGLPDTCKLTTGKPSCILCISAETLIKRCSKNIRRNFDPLVFCKHNTRHIKCLDADRDFALNINLITPIEKRFSRDLVMLAETLRLITESRISDQELKSNVASILSAIIRHSNLFINEPIQFERLIAVLASNSISIKKNDQMPRFKESLLSLFGDIQKKRQLGNLEFQDSLNLIKSIMQSLSDSTELESIFEDLETTGMSADEFRLSTDP